MGYHGPAPLSDVVVVGGGLAGCATAMELCGQGLDVLVLDEGAGGTGPEGTGGPDAKLLTPEAQGLLGRLGIPGISVSQGLHGLPLRTLRIVDQTGATRERPLPGASLSLSPHTLVAHLRIAARAAGAVFVSGARVQDVRAVPEADGGGTRVRFLQGGLPREARAALVVGAYGGDEPLDRALWRGGPRDYAVLYGPHLGDAALRADFHGAVELHALPGGYGVLYRLDERTYHLAVLLRADDARCRGSWSDLREALRGQAPSLARRLGQLRPLAPIRLRRQGATGTQGLFAEGVLLVGNAAAAFAPLCGDSATLALRSAQLAAPLICGHLRGAMSRSDLRRRYERAFAAAFRAPLLRGRAAQEVLLRPGLLRASLELTSRLPALGRLLCRSAPSGVAPAEPAANRLAQVDQEDQEACGAR